MSQVREEQNQNAMAAHHLCTAIEMLGTMHFKRDDEYYELLIEYTKK